MSRREYEIVAIREDKSNETVEMFVNGRIYDKSKKKIVIIICDNQYLFIIKAYFFIHYNCHIAIIIRLLCIFIFLLQ